MEPEAKGPATRHSPLARQLLAAYALLVIYASLDPFWPWQDSGVGALAWLTAPMPRYITAFDTVMNILGYMPLGFLCVLALEPRLSGVRAVAFGTMAAVLLSGTMESLQTYLPSRIASNIDFTCNSAGALLGSLIGVASKRYFLYEHGLQQLRRKAFRPGSTTDLGLMVLGLWMFCQLNPETLLYGNGDLRPLFQQTIGELYGAEVFIRFEAAVAAANVLAVGLLTATLMRPGRPVRQVVIVLLFASLVARALAYALLGSPTVTLVWATPGALFGIAGGTLATMILVALPAPLRLVLCGLALMAATAMVNFAPGNPYLLETLAAWPQGQFLHFNGLTRLVSAIWPFAALACLVGLAAEQGRRV